jgi:hypothetical protein
MGRFDLYRLGWIEGTFASNNLDGRRVLALFVVYIYGSVPYVNLRYWRGTLSIFKHFAKGKHYQIIPGYSRNSKREWAFDEANPDFQQIWKGVLLVADMRGAHGRVCKVFMWNACETITDFKSWFREQCRRTFSPRAVLYISESGKQRTRPSHWHGTDEIVSSVVVALRVGQSSLSQ